MIERLDSMWLAALGAPRGASPWRRLTRAWSQTRARATTRGVGARFAALGRDVTTVPPTALKKLRCRSLQAAAQAAPAPRGAVVAPLRCMERSSASRLPGRCRARARGEARPHHADSGAG